MPRDDDVDEVSGRVVDGQLSYHSYDSIEAHLPWRSSWDYRLMADDEKRFVGMWWRADDEDSKIGGVLEISDEGRCRLELVGELLGHHDAEVLLHGSALGKSITIVNAIVGNGGKTVYGQQHTRTQMLDAEAVLIGIHLGSSEDRIFNSMWVSIANLTKWCERTGFDTNLDFLGPGPESAQWTMKYDMQDDIVVPVPSRSEEVVFSWQVLSKSLTTTEKSRDYQMQEIVRVGVRSDETRGWRGFWRTARNVQDLVTIAAQGACAITSVDLRISDGEGGQERVDLHFRHGMVGPGEDRDATRFIFHLDDLEIEEAINKWIRLAEVVGLPLDVLLGLYYDPNGYYENNIFNAASAAEGFHKALRPDSVDLVPDKHADLIRRVKETFSADELDWVLPRVGSNRPGLKGRYLELADIPEIEAVENLLGNVEVWARWLKGARNAIGHLNTGELDKKVPESARFRLTYVTRALLHLVIMTEIGLPRELQVQAVNEVWWYSADAFSKAVKEHG